MNWIDYTKQKPTDKDAQYLIAYDVRHLFGSFTTTEIAHWNGRTFYNEDWEECSRYEYKKQVRHWMKIEEPSADKTDPMLAECLKRVDPDVRAEVRKKMDLTWQDVKRIVEIADDIIRKACYEHMSEEEYYTEVLRRFKEQ